MRQAVLILCAAIIAPAQKADGPAFEVASVKRTPPPEPNARVFFGPPRGGPGMRDPEQITWTNAAMRNLLMTAFDMHTYQIVGPDWMSAERYDIAAKVAPGATKQQVMLMWQNLLKERFALTIHHESKDFIVDELTIAKGGPKLTRSDLPDDADPFMPDGPLKRDKNGAVEMNGYGMIVSIFPSPSGSTSSMRANGLTMADFASRLGQPLRHPVIDKTGLTGRFDFTLDYTPDLSGLPPPPDRPLTPPGTSEPGTDLPYALEKQLGLKLVSGKAKLDVIVVDHIEKTPTDN
jgi:uncharacterized protein (TIGR03435 family)